MPKPRHASAVKPNKLPVRGVIVGRPDNADAARLKSPLLADLDLRLFFRDPRVAGVHGPFVPLRLIGDERLRLIQSPPKMSVLHYVPRLEFFLLYKSHEGRVGIRGWLVRLFLGLREEVLQGD